MSTEEDTVASWPCPLLWCFEELPSTSRDQAIGAGVYLGLVCDLVCDLGCGPRSLQA